MQAWHEIEGAAHLKAGEMTHAERNGEDILILNVEGSFRAFVNRCGHMNAPLDLGTFKSGVIKCAQHNAVFDANSGEVRGQPALSMPGIDMNKLPPEFLKAMERMGPIFARTLCRPLTPVPLESSAGKLRVWV